MSEGLGPRKPYRYKRDWQNIQFEVVGPLYSLEAVLKPLPVGTILTTLCEGGVYKDERYVKVSRRFIHRRNRSPLTDWVKRRDLFKPELVLRYLAADTEKTRKTERTLRALANIKSFAPRSR